MEVLNVDQVTTNGHSYQTSSSKTVHVQTNMYIVYSFSKENLKAARTTHRSYCYSYSTALFKYLALYSTIEHVSSWAFIFVIESTFKVTV